LNFKKGNTGQTVFAGQDKLKLVTHCSEERFILKEYLAYKAYQLINPQGFQVRLARVTYIDKSRVHKTTRRYAFIIEDKDAMATRLGGTAVPDSVRFSEKQTLHHETAQLYLFQYLLGNRDWDISMKKNVKLVQKTSGDVLALPYDFDFTGWVSAPYTVAYMGNLAKTFEYRSGRKFCATEEEWEKHIQHFLDKKPELLALINNFKPLSKKEKASMLEFIEAFYDEIKKPNKAVELFGDC
jgi:succinate dehydrogenase flavin-adding protein (antitoxin of CptAB toxin-antitoxin module)